MAAEPTNLTSAGLLAPRWDPSTLRATAPASAPTTDPAPERGLGRATGTRRVVLTPGGGFHENWQMELSDPRGERGLILRFGILTSRNGFKRHAEAWALFFQKNAGRDPTKLAVRQSFDIRAFTVPAPGRVQIGECRFDEREARGAISSKGQTLEWDLRMEPRSNVQAELYPPSLTRTPLGQYSAATVNGDLIYRGEIRLNGETFAVEGAPGLQSHAYGPRMGHSWVRAQANHFVDERGTAVPAVFEGISGRARLAGPIASPRISSFHIVYRGQAHAFHSLRDLLRIHSTLRTNEWTFQADRGELSFRGRARAELKDFIGLNLEDTDGSLLYGACTKIADLELRVYRRGKLESSLRADGTAALEIVTRAKNPYVPPVI